MLRYQRAARGAEVVHFQWLSVQQLDGRLLPRGRPLVLTAHDVLPRERAEVSARRSDACTTASTRSSPTPRTAARG